MLGIWVVLNDLQFTPRCKRGGEEDLKSKPNPMLVKAF